MTKEEFNAKRKQSFIARLQREVTDAEYAEIEFVYNWHPSISNTEGKDQIAYLYNTFGMRIIRDMMPTAKKAKELDSEILATKHRLEELQEEYAELTK